MKTIRFYNMMGTETGHVTIDNAGTMKGSNDNMQRLVDDWRLEGSTPQQFVENFENWGNGYASSKLDESESGS